MTKSFIVLFQFVQVKSYSEAICETVGSLMKIHGGRGRNLHPTHFSKELCLKFNLPPVHIMKHKFIPEIAKKLVDVEKKEYFTKTDQNKLKFSSLSATIGNFRNKEEETSHLPLNMFTIRT